MMRSAVPTRSRRHRIDTVPRGHGAAQCSGRSRACWPHLCPPYKSYICRRVSCRWLTASSWPGSSRPSTSSLPVSRKKDVDARDISAFTRVFDALCAGM